MARLEIFLFLLNDDDNDDDDDDGDDDDSDDITTTKDSGSILFFCTNSVHGKLMIVSFLSRKIRTILLNLLPNVITFVSCAMT